LAISSTGVARVAAQVMLSLQSLKGLLDRRIARQIGCERLPA
jgi:hypothetical protein